MADRAYCEKKAENNNNHNKLVRIYEHSTLVQTHVRIISRLRASSCDYFNDNAAVAVVKFTCAPAPVTIRTSIVIVARVRSDDLYWPKNDSYRRMT